MNALETLEALKQLNAFFIEYNKMLDKMESKIEAETGKKAA